MEYTLDIARQSPGGKPWRQTFLVEDSGESSVSTILDSISSQVSLDAKGEPAEPVVWECGCLQGKCGACAMRINGVPRLACSAFLREFPKRRILVEPLGKFPVIKDLAVDRSGMFESLKQAKLWLEGEAFNSKFRHDACYQSAMCLMCGCCLDVCPNFMPDEEFFGAALAVNAYRILEQSEAKSIALEYKKRYWHTCGKSLSCDKVCPAKLPVEELMARANAIAIWGK
ncbi:MAG: 4Fe-4S dicluster domain-containing protein [Clostridiales bacterium]|jgi:succinate dehydrogenase / fumarate reductase iron-sulfur subunit|nr:4Fe-4S dicluster domain-containing protein [Clostridiales bacterium]